MRPIVTRSLHTYKTYSIGYWMRSKYPTRAMSKIHVHLIAAARPNFMKVAPLYHALNATDWCVPNLIHTGQHYDFNMSGAFFRDLGLPEPDFHLEVGSGSHAEQTGGVMIAYERVALESRPDCVIVVGDVNSTAACALVGTKLGIPVVHLEAGLRSRDRTMPEEINRLVTDAIADVLWTPSSDGDDNLLSEGVAADKIDLVGNIMIDSFEMMRAKIEASNALEVLGLAGADYGVVTLHRPSNVDDSESLGAIVDALTSAAAKIRVAFVAHPRTVKMLEQFGLLGQLESNDRILLVEPLPYVDFMRIVTGANVVITDSGGLQEETTYLRIPCLTLRENTERPITVTLGTNRLVNVTSLAAELDKALSGDWPEGQVPPLWDGKTAGRAVAALKRRLSA